MRMEACCSLEKLINNIDNQARFRYPLIEKPPMIDSNNLEAERLEGVLRLVVEHNTKEVISWKITEGNFLRWPGLAF
jgi:hypothetical protein